MARIKIRPRRLLVSTIVMVTAYFVLKRLQYYMSFIDIQSLLVPTQISVAKHLSVTLKRTGSLPLKTEVCGKVTNAGTLGAEIGFFRRMFECDNRHDGLCYRWQPDLQLTIKTLDDDCCVTCYDIAWTTTSCEIPLRDCYSLSHAHWYGGFEFDQQLWPLNDIQQPLEAYVTSYFTSTGRNAYGSVIERLFLSSNGFGIFVYPEVPLYLSFNENGDRQICLVAKCNEFPYSNKKDNPPSLRYKICQGPNVKDIYEYLTSKHVTRPRDIPNTDLFRAPIWSTWAMFKKNVNQTKVLNYARKIVESGFPYSQLEIDDNWTPHYGDLDFNKTRFPDPKGMIQELSKMGMKVTVWIHPFFDLDSKAAEKGIKKGYVVKGRRTESPAVSHWRHPWEKAYVLDVTNSDAVTWYLESTRFLKETYNVTSFKFDYGEATWLTEQHRTKLPLEYPDKYARYYVDMALAADPEVRAQEVRVGFRTQDVPLMTRMLDRRSNWGTKLGLRTLIPTALTFGIIGYPFVQADMIGGNDRSLQDNPELFIRWLQANTFLPFLQFSTGPWIYNSTVVSICRKFVDLHMTYSDLIISLARESTRTGVPIVRPLWWIAPTDEVALTTDSQFLLGDDLLVAPVLEEGARSRDIYLPTGTWQDMLRAVRYQGPQWLRGYPAAIDELPFFKRTVNNNGPFSG